jgi:hypothetical protein
LAGLAFCLFQLLGHYLFSRLLSSKNSTTIIFCRKCVFNVNKNLTK